jgi:predicted RNA-binding Zn-ribbon protein involved in translation (DUF1610 family)
LPVVQHHHADEIADGETVIVVSARSKALEHACPQCGTLSSRIHMRLCGH